MGTVGVTVAQSSENGRKDVGTERRDSPIDPFMMKAFVACVIVAGIVVDERPAFPQGFGAEAGAGRAIEEASETDVSQQVKELGGYAQSDLAAEQFEDWRFHSPAFYGETGESYRLHSDTHVGFVHSAGNSESYSIAGDEKLVLRKGKLTNHLTLGGIYGKRAANEFGPSTTSNRYLALKHASEYSVANDYYVQLGSGYYTDKLSGVRHNIRGNLAVGVYALESAKQTLKLELGYDFTRQLTSTTEDESLHSAVPMWEYHLHLGDRLRLSSEAEALFDVQQGDNIRAKADLRLQLGITRYLAFGLSVQWRFDGDPVGDAKRSDLVQMATIVLSGGMNAPNETAPRQGG